MEPRTILNTKRVLWRVPVLIYDSALLLTFLGGWGVMAVPAAVTRAKASQPKPLGPDVLPESFFFF